jgi:glycosyltransferase involved in cell wall biosynthesis
MSLTGEDIVCLSTHYWDQPRFRKQEFMARFAAANRVLYVEPSYSMVRPPRSTVGEVATNRLFRPGLSQRTRNLHLLKPPRKPPYWSKPPVEYVTYAWHARTVRQAIQQLKFVDPIVWIYRPAWARHLSVIPHSRLVFELVDDLTGYPGVDPAVVEADIRSLARQSDLFVVTADTLRSKFGADARHVEVVPNGFDADRFSPERIGASLPEDLASIPGPILGFVGTLFSFLDYDLMEAVAKANPDKSLVLIGPVDAPVAEAVRRLAELRNVHHLGPRTQDEIPRYVAGFDVCLCPFKKGRTADSVSPLKVYEYLAMGRPVVSAPMKALEGETAGRAVVFADGADEFNAAIAQCLTPAVQAGTEARRQAVASYSWAGLFERVDAAAAAIVSPAS